MKKIFMVSLALTVLAVSIGLFQMTSCTKAIAQTKTDTIYMCNSSINGLWSGTIQDATSVPQPYNLSIKADGTISFEGIALNQEHFGVGTWTLTDSILTCNITTLYGLSYNVGIKQTLTAVFNNKTGILSSGKWIDIYPNTATSSGTFMVKKVN